MINFADRKYAMLERLLTLKEVAETVRLSESTLRRAIKAGEIDVIRAGRRGQIRVSQSAMDAFLARKSCSPQVTMSPTAPSMKVSDEASDGAIERQRTGTILFGGDEPLSLTYRLLTADVRKGLEVLPTASVNCAVTSPPYYWQRDYGVDGQIGKEPTIQGFVNALVESFRGLKRVLTADGTFFLNLGDGFYNAKGKPHGKDPKHSARMLARNELRAVDGPGLGLPRKSLIGMPWRVALALQADGWILRSAIVWNRPGALGEPTGRDRPSRAYEMVFMFSKSQKYFFDRGGLVKGEEDIWTFPARPDNPFSHAAPFPIELVDRCLACGCPPGGIVLDPFAGSGTTLVSALRSGRHALGIDLNEVYVAHTEQRIKNDMSRRGGVFV